MRHARSLLVAVLAAACLVALPGVVLGHVELKSSSPAAGDNLDAAPTEVSVTFDDELDLDLSHFTVTDAGGNEVGSGDVDLTVADRNVMNGSVEIRDPGVYTVSYTVAGVDGHVLEGTFSFGFRTDAQIPRPTHGEHGPDTAIPGPRSPILPLLGVILLALAGALVVRRLPLT